MAKKQTWQQVYSDMQKEEEKQKWWQGWFQKGAFADGYDFGDITKTYLGLRADLSQNVFTAVVDATENLMDTGAYVVGMFGNKNFKQKIGDFIAKDTFQKEKVAKFVYDYIPYDALGVNVWSKYVIGDDVEANSVLNEKSDSLVQSVAHQVGSRMLDRIGVPWQLTTGVNSFGSETEEAFGKGAKFWEAGVSGLISAGAEIGAESLFSGSTLGEKGLINLDNLTSGIKNKALKAVADWGWDAAKEGVEEMVTNFASSLGQAIYESDSPEEYWQVVQDKNTFDELMNAFVSGAAMSAGGNFINMSTSVKTGTDYRTGLTAQEQTVFDKVYQDKVDNYVSENGKKPTGTAKKQIFTDTLNELNSGAISVDTVGSVIAPETTKQYQEVTGKLTQLQQEYAQLSNNTEKTETQQQRQTDLEQEISDLKKQQQDLDERIASFAKGTRMEESYREQARKSQKFQADSKQYKNSSASQTVQNIVDSGVMNNTRRSHEFVGLLAKISEEKGIVFTTTDAQRLKDTGLSVEGATVNGYYTENGVAININSPKALESVVGHELAHALEGSDFYEPLKTALVSYAKNKGEYDSLMATLANLYRGKKGYETDFDAKMERELVADLVGKYLFTDADFVRTLSVQNRNLFQRLFDEIKSLLRIAKAGSKEAKQLEKIKKLFEEAYRDAKNTAPSDGVKYSIVALENGNVYVKASRNVITGDTLSEKRQNITDFFNNLLEGQPSLDIQTIEGDVLTITKADTADKARDNYREVNGKRVKLSDDEFAVKLHVESHIDEIAETSRNISQLGIKPDSKNHSFAKDGFTYRRAYFEDFDGQYYEITLSIGHNGSVATVYNVGKVKESVLPSAKIIAVVGSKALGKTPSKFRVSEDNKNVNKKFSLSEDTVAEQADGKNTYSQDVAVEQTETETPEDVQQQITDLQGRLQQAVQDGDMDEAALIGKELYDLQHPDEPLGTNENTDPGAQEDVPDPVKAILGEETDFLSKRADELYQEIGTLKKGSGKRASATLSYLLDHIGKDWTPLKTALLNIKDNPAETVNPKSAAESIAREVLSKEYQDSAEELQEMQVAAKKPAEIRTAKDRFMAQIYNLEVELATTKANKQQSLDDYNAEIAELEELYDSKAKKTTKVANDIKARIARTIRRRDNQDASYDRAIARIQESLARKMTDEAKTANQRQFKQEQLFAWAENLVGDTSTWVDKKFGWQYMINTLRRNLRAIVKDENGNPDYAKADAIYEELQGQYNLNEAELNRELVRLRDKYRDLKITKEEDAYIQMLGEFRHNPQTELSLETVEGFYKANKSKINTDKVDKIIEMARKDYDDLIRRVNEVLREHGMKEIPYRQGYFPHFTLDKQGKLAKLLNWKTRNDDIPTDIAGLTESFEPNRSYQSFNKERTSDITDYSFMQGFDQYTFGALDWIYHIEDIQKRRALENYIRYVHSDEGVKAKIDAIKNNEEYDADEAQKQIDAVYAEAKNPLNNFVVDLRRGTQTLAAKKSPLDREIEYATNRKIYQTMTNISNRVSANMVAGSISSALTNFIPITQSWGGVSPLRSLQGMAQTLRNTIRDDGMIDKSAFLTNRLRKADNLYKTGWDKVSDKVSLLMNAVDSFTAQTVWRSRYDTNMAKGMSETDAIHDADLFAEAVMAGRSRGNMPTAFDSKNPLIKMVTAFQLEVANQYGYLFKDMPQDVRNQNKAKLLTNYVLVFAGAYVYNCLFKAMTGRTAAFDPFRIIEELLRDVFDAADEEDGKDKKWSQVAGNFAENVLQEVPFVGGLLGGGRVPISSALPYDGLLDAFKGTIGDIEQLGEGGLKNLTKEWLNPVIYGLMPMGGGQLKKTIEGISMFTGDKPVSGSYTTDGNLRFSVEPTVGKVAQAALFGQWASSEAQQYIDEGRKPLSEKQTKEFAELDIPIEQYWDIRDNLNRIDKSASKTKQADKVDYINSLNLTVEQKNILVNNILDRKENVDMTDYDKYGSFAEFDFSIKQPEKYSFLKQNGISYADYAHDKDAYNWAYENPGKYTVSKLFLTNFTQYYSYRKNISAIEADKDELGRSIDGTLKAKRAKYIGSLPLTKIEKAILMKQCYASFTDADNAIIQFIASADYFSRDEKIIILYELGLLPEEFNLALMMGGNV